MTVRSTPACRISDPTLKHTITAPPHPVSAVYVLADSVCVPAPGHADASCDSPHARKPVGALTAGTMTVSTHTAQVIVWAEMGVCREDGWFHEIGTMSTTGALLACARGPKSPTLTRDRHAWATSAWSVGCPCFAWSPPVVIAVENHVTPYRGRCCIPIKQISAVNRGT